MFARGELDLAKTRTLVCGVAVLDQAGAHAVEAHVLPRAADSTGPQLSAGVRRAVLRVDPDAAQRRQQAMVRDRCVSFQPLDDGAAALWAVGPAQDLQALFTAITALGDRATGSHPSDDRTLDQRRFDVLTDAAYLHFERDDLPRRQGRRPHLQVTVAATTLLGFDDNPAELAGYGPITAEVARRIAADAEWTRLLTEPVSGIVTDYGTTRYRAPRSLTDKVLATHPTCRRLGCRQPAARCETDHPLEYPHGPTADYNLGPRCKRCHRSGTSARGRCASSSMGRSLHLAGRAYLPPRARPTTRCPTVLTHDAQVTGDGDREQRQYLLMQQRIAAFRAGQLSIGALIADLEGLLSALEEATEEWTDRFRGQCGVLEVAYAVARDRQDPPPTATDDDIAAALDALDSLLHERARP